MSIITNADKVRNIYKRAMNNSWVLPCFCTENLTSTEAILTAAEEYRVLKSLKRLPIIIAITCRYDHRSQAVNYTHTKRWDIGLKLFMADLRVLCDESDAFENLEVMVHLDHIQHDLDEQLLDSDMSIYSSIMYDASNLSIKENTQKTKDFVIKCSNEIVIEGACDEIVDATGTVRNALTTPEKAKAYFDETGVDMIVANLGTEHRATAKELQYHGDYARRIRDLIGTKIVLHGASSVPNEQIHNLIDDGIIKVNIWTTLERDSSPILFEHMVKNACRTAGDKTVKRLIDEDYLGGRCLSGSLTSIDYFTTVSRQNIVFLQMKKIVKSYLDMWYKI